MTCTGDEYVENLENVIKQMLRPLKDIPMKLVIEALSGHKIIPFDPNNKGDGKVLDILCKVAKLAGSRINKTGIVRNRPNEVGNDIEPFVREALNHFGYKADTPVTSSGKRKSTGYPDIEFIDGSGRYQYLECKTYNIKNVDTTQRSFYLSPAEDFKVTRDAHHFVLSYEIFVAGRRGRMNIFKCRHWKILSIENLLVDVKYEFNSDNDRLYADNLVLAQGTL